MYTYTCIYTTLNIQDIVYDYISIPYIYIYTSGQRSEGEYNYHRLTMPRMHPPNSRNTMLMKSVPFCLFLWGLFSCGIIQTIRNKRRTRNKKI